MPRNTPELGAPPYLTTRHHAALFLIQVLLSMPIEYLEGGIYMIRGHNREIFRNGRWLPFEHVISLVQNHVRILIYWVEIEAQLRQIYSQPNLEIPLSHENQGKSNMFTIRTMLNPNRRISSPDKVINTTTTLEI